MTVKEFYEKLPTQLQNILAMTNTAIVENRWTQNTQYSSIIQHLSTQLFLFNFEKELNPMVLYWFEINNYSIETINATNFQTFLRFLVGQYKDKWSKLWDNVFLRTYNPIWNVEGTDQTVHTFEHGKTTQETRNMTDTHNKGATETTTITSDITNNSRSGFNSSTPVGTDSTSRTGSSHVTGSGNDSDVMTGTDTFTNSGVDTERTTLTRGMNIGVQSTQSLLTQEIELRTLFNYFDIVIKDIINELALNIYI